MSKFVCKIKFKENIRKRISTPNAESVSLVVREVWAREVELYRTQKSISGTLGY